MLHRIAASTIASAVLLAWAGAAASQVLGPSSGSGNLKSRPQVDATPPTKDSETGKIAATSVLLTNQIFKIESSYRAQRLMRFYATIEPAEKSDQENRLYDHVFVAIPTKVVDEKSEDFPKDIQLCHLSGNMSIAGVELVAQIGPVISVEVHGMGQGSAYFNQACAAFSRAERRSAGHFEKLSTTNLMGFSLPVSVLVVSREHGTAQTFEDASLRLYWANMFSEYGDKHPFALLTRKYGEGLIPALLEAVERSDLHSLSFSLDPVDDSPPPSASRPFPNVGPPRLKMRLQELDSQWSKYIAKVRLSDEDRDIPVDRFGRIGAILPRFRASDLGSQEFWAHLEDSYNFLVKVNCLGSYFLVEQGLASSNELDNYRECTAAFTDKPRLP